MKRELGCRDSHVRGPLGIEVVCVEDRVQGVAIAVQVLASLLDQIDEPLPGTRTAGPNAEGLDRRFKVGGRPVVEVAYVENQICRISVAIEIQGSLSRFVDEEEKPLSGKNTDGAPDHHLEVCGCAQFEVMNVEDNLVEGPREVRLRFDETRAGYYGLSFEEVAADFRAANEGIVASSFRAPGADTEIDIRVLFDEPFRRNIREVLRAPVRTRCQEIEWYPAANSKRSPRLL